MAEIKMEGQKGDDIPPAPAPARRTGSLREKFPPFKKPWK
jgi:hypothetical protein